MILIINVKAPESMVKKLEGMGHKVIRSISCPGLIGAVAEHPDMQIHPLREDLAIVPPACYDYYRKQLPQTIEVISGERDLCGTYPADCAYNVARVKDMVFCNVRCTDPGLLAFYQGEGFRIIHTNQGYTKCNMAFIGNDCVVTEDCGIHNTIIANKLGLTSILIPSGEVSLPGFSYGFIGGACGSVGNTLVWYGNPQNCSYFGLLQKETNERGVVNYALSPEPLGDFGGIICFSS